MAFVHGAQTRLFLGEKHISGVVSGFTCSFDASLAETTNLLAGGSTFIPGLTNGELGFEGFIEQQKQGGATTIQDTIRDVSQTDSGALMTAAPGGLVMHYPSFFCKADISSFEIESSVDDAVSFSVESQGDEGIDWGHLLHVHTAVSADGDGSALDHGDSTGSGGAAMLHVTDVTGAPDGFEVVVQHSDDDDTYVDLVTFSSVDEPAAEFKTVSGTVNQYIRASWSFDGGTSPTATFVLSFARR